MFYQSVLQLFVHFNKLLQREDPIIYMLSDEINHFFKKLLGKFVSVPAIKGASSISQVDYHNKAQRLPGKIHHTCVTTIDKEL